MRKCYGLVFLGWFSRISDGHPFPFYPEVPPEVEKPTMENVYVTNCNQLQTRSLPEWKLTTSFPCIFPEVGSAQILVTSEEVKSRGM